MSESGDPNDPAPRPCGSSSLRPPRPKSQVGTPPGPRTAPRDGGFARPCLGLAFQPPATMGRGASSLRRPLSSASAQAAAVTTPQGPRMAPSRSAGRRPAGRHLEEGCGQPCGPRGFSPPSPPRRASQRPPGVSSSSSGRSTVSAHGAGAAVSFRTALPSGDRVPLGQAEHPVP